MAQIDQIKVSNMSSTDIIKDNIAPLVQRILSDPLYFKPAKLPEATSNRPSSYIKISDTDKQLKSSKENTSTTSSPAKSRPDMIKTRPTSLAEAVAGYTSKRSITESQDKKLLKKPRVTKFPEQSQSLPLPIKPREEDEFADLGISLEEETASENKDDISSTESDDTHYEDAIESPDSDTQAKSESEQPISATNSDEDEEDDGDYENGSESDSFSSEEEDNVDEDQEDSRKDSDEKEESDSVETLKQDLLNDKIRSISSSSSETDDKDSSDQNVISKPLINKLENFYEFNELASDRGSNNSNRILKNWGNVLSKSKPSGLLNHGVTCYTNAAVQAMIHIPAVQHYLDDVLANKHKDTINPRSVTHVFAETAARMWDKTKKIKYINPKKLIGRLDDINCMMSEWQQEDSHEYFMSLLSRMQEDSTPKGHKLNESIIYDIFGGLLQQSVTCKKCGHVSKTQQEFYDLSLHLGSSRKNSLSNDSQQNINSHLSTEDELPSQKYSIIKSIKDFFSPELIKPDKSDKSGYLCENCKNRTNAIKISTIDRAPETLAVHLKRFRFNGNSSSKVKQGVTYPLILDLSQYNSNHEPVLYELVSVVVHEGRSVSSGHYVSHCRQPDGTWATYDDEYINTITEKQALRDPSAYYLIYSRLTHKDIHIKHSPEKITNNYKQPTMKDDSTSSPSSSPSSSGSSASPEIPKRSETTKPHSRKALLDNINQNKKRLSVTQAKSPVKNKNFIKTKVGSHKPTNNLGNLAKKSLKKYSKKDQGSRRFKKY